MKIIGETAKGFLLEAGKEELVNLCGYYHSWGTEAPVLKIDTVIRVHEMYNYLRDIKRSESALLAAAQVLRRVADQVELVSPVFSPPESGRD